MKYNNEIIKRQIELLNEYKDALGLNGGCFDEERCKIIQRELDRCKFILEFKGNTSKKEFDLRLLNKELL